MIRTFLGVVFIAYGTVKLLGGQFVYDDWTIQRSTVGGPSLVWSFYGYSPVYARFVALCELVPGILLLIPRTAFVGAAALFPVALNITVMDFTYGFPSVKYWALLYTVLLGGLLWVEREKLLLFLAPIEQVRAALAAVGAMPRTHEPPPRLAPWVRRIVAVTGAAFVLFVANLVAEGSSEGPEARALRAAEQRTGETGLVLRRSRYRGLLAVGRTATVDLAAPGDTAVTWRVHASRALGFVPWRVDSVVRMAR